MRWNVEVSRIGDSKAAESYCLEAKQWQAALQEARKLRGDSGALSKLSIEMLDDGYRAIDPALRLRYVVSRAPVDAPLSSDKAVAHDATPAGPGCNGKPTASESPPATELSAPPTTGIHPGPRIVMPDDVPPPLRAASSSQTAPRPKPGPSIRPTQPSLATVRPPDFTLVRKREEEPRPDAPITYREYAYAVNPDTTRQAAEVLLWMRFREVTSNIADRPGGKFVQLAVFDHVFEKRPHRAPIATLAWKDWRGDPIVQFPRDSQRPSSSPPAPSSYAPPVSAPTDSAAGEATRGSSSGSPPEGRRPQTGPSGSPPEGRRPQMEPPAPLAADTKRPSSRPPPAGNAKIAIGHIIDVGGGKEAASRPTTQAARWPPTPTSTRDTIPNAAQPLAERSSSAPPPEPAMEPAARKPVSESERAPTGEPTAAAPEPTPEPTPAVTVEPTEAAAPSPRSALTPSGAPSPTEKAEPVKPMADGASPDAGAALGDAVRAAGDRTASAQPDRDVVNKSDAAVRARIKSEPTLRRRRKSGEDLIGELFEVMHELSFMADVVSGAEFVLATLTQMLPSDATLVHVFDINTGQFVVVRAAGPNAENVLLHRTPGDDPLFAAAMRRLRSIRTDEAKKDPHYQGGRWQKVGITPESALCGGVKQGGRYLGALELVNPLGGGPFHEGEVNALDYICEQFAEFLLNRPIVVDADVVRPLG